MKSTYKPQGLSEEDLDLSLLPSLCLSDQVLDDAQKLVANPHRLDLISRLKSSMFSDNTKAYAILGKVTATDLLSEDGTIEEHELKVLVNTDEQLDGLLDMFEPIDDNPDINSSLDKTDEKDTDDESDGDFTDEDLQQRDVCDPPVDEQTKGSISPDITSRPQSRLEVDVLVQKVAHLEEMVEKMGQALESKLVLLQKVICTSNSQNQQLSDRVKNIEEMVANLTTSFSGYIERNKISSQVPPPATKVAPRVEMPKKDKIGATNMAKIKTRMLKSNIYTASDATDKVVDDFLLATIPSHVLELGQCLGLSLTYEEAEKISKTTWEKSEVNKVILDIIKNAFERSRTDSQDICLPVSTEKQPTPSAPKAGLSLFSKRTY